VRRQQALPWRSRAPALERRVILGILGQDDVSLLRLDEVEVEVEVGSPYMAGM
jgi:hypothetical protein